jgi:hypothetical protein
MGKKTKIRPLHQPQLGVSVLPQRWRGGRVVEGTGLENRRGGDVSVGSNPTPSANTS